MSKIRAEIFKAPENQKELNEKKEIQDIGSGVMEIVTDPQHIINRTEYYMTIAVAKETAKNNKKIENGNEER